MLNKIIIKNAVVRKPGFLYYIDGEGNICEAKMAHGKKNNNKKQKSRSLKGGKNTK